MGFQCHMSADSFLLDCVRSKCLPHMFHILVYLYKDHPMYPQNAFKPRNFYGEGFQLHTHSALPWQCRETRRLALLISHCILCSYCKANLGIQDSSGSLPRLKWRNPGNQNRDFALALRFRNRSLCFSSLRPLARMPVRPPRKRKGPC